MSNRHGRYILGAAFALFAAVVTGSTFSLSGQPATMSSGEELFKKRCGGCHSLDNNKEGPRLRGVYGRVAGTVDSFQYSDALKKSKITWIDGTLDKWLTDTEKLVPDNDMSFRVENPEERREIILFLKQTSSK